MLATKVLFALGMMTVAIIILPIQIAKLVYRRAKRYSPTVSQCLLLITPFPENECPNIVLTVPEDYEPRDHRNNQIKTEIKAVH